MILVFFAALSLQEESYPLRLEFDANPEGIWSLAIAPDGKILATGGGDGKIDFWEVPGGGKRKRLTGHGWPVHALVFSVEGKWLASGSQDRTARLWDPATGEEAAPFLQHSDAVRCVALSPDAAGLVTGSRDGRLRLWDVRRGAMLREFGEELPPVFSAAWSPDGKTLVSGHGDGSLRFWNVADGKEFARAAHPSTEFLAGLKKEVETLNAKVRELEEALAAEKNEEKRLQIRRTLQDTADLRDKKKRAVADLQERFDTMRRQGGATVASLKPGVTTIAFHPRGTVVYSGSQDRTVRVWNAADGADRGGMEGHEGTVNSVAISRDGARMVTGSEDFRVRIWDPETRRLVAVLAAHRQSVRGVAVTPDGRTLASGSADGKVRLWVRSGR